MTTSSTLPPDPTPTAGDAAGVEARRILVVGATGTIGRATVRALRRAGHRVTCLVRARAQPASEVAPRAAPFPDGVTVRTGDVSDRDSLVRHAFSDEPFHAIVSCMASRSGAPRDAWAIDHRAHRTLLEVARAHGVPQWVQLSAICVQKPRLAFQHAKLAFEEALMGSGLTWSIVRPTAFFKSLSGQVQRVRDGRPYVMIGDGALTRCKPIGDDDVAEYLAGCLADRSRWNRILPIGGPGEAISPREQGELLFELTGRPPRYTRVPLSVFNAIVATLGVLGRVVPPLADKAEFARIGRYYATESMLVWDAERQRYDADATPSVGRETLRAHYARMLRGEAGDDRGEHAVF
ncbi:MAG TPA: NAD(P)H-binding protein [Gemmatimonadaceae bacterium]|nr:NAD(P)H-binding protein [Gemmatimonadaceae bacterium]